MFCFTAGTDNANGNSNNIIFTIKDAKLYVPVITLSAKGNQKLSKRFCKGSERSVYWNEYKTKSENKNMTNEYRYFFQSNFLGVNVSFVSVYSNQDDNSKKWTYYLPRGVIDNYNVITNGKTFMINQLSLI